MAGEFERGDFPRFRLNNYMCTMIGYVIFVSTVSSFWTHGNANNPAVISPSCPLGSFPFRVAELRRGENENGRQDVA